MNQDFISKILYNFSKFLVALGWHAPISGVHLLDLTLGSDRSCHAQRLGLALRQTSAQPARPSTWSGRCCQAQ
jgi:hypothetical protein